MSDRVKIEPHASRVKFGVRIHQRGYSYEELRRVSTAADMLGYHSVTLYDLLNAPALECWTTLAALAAETQHIRLTPLVLANLYRSPGLLAKMSSTVDVISKGRLELGIGAGGDGADHLASGIEFPSTPVRVRMLEEAIHIIKALWTAADVSYEGRFYTLTRALNQPKPVQAPHPPILVGGHGERHVLRAVARYADICNVGFEMGLEEHRAKLKVLEEHCKNLGRVPSDIEVSHNTRIFIAEDGAQYHQMVGRGASNSGTSLREYEASLKRAIAGTPEQCVEQIEGYVRAGITYFFLLFPEPISEDSLRLFAKQVIPHFTA